MPRNDKPKIECPLCGGNHHVLECDAPALRTLNQKVARIKSDCARCGGPVEFLGPYCIDCTVDRAFARLLGRKV